MISAKSVIILGLDNSHPFVDARNLLALDPSITLVLVDNVRPDSRDRFLNDFPATVLVPDLKATFRLAPIGMIVTLRPSALLVMLPEILTAGMPTFINKQGLATREQLDTALSTLAGQVHRLMTSSVLRFAPDVRCAVVDRRSLQSIHVSIRHCVDHWKRAGNEWQGDIHEGGGIVGSLGYHGFDLLDELAGEGFAVDAATVQSKQPGRLAGGDHAIIAGHWVDGTSGVIELDATGNEEQYDVRLVYEDHNVLISLDESRVDGYGYQGAMAAFLEHTAGVTAPTWTRSLALIEASATAHQLAYGSNSR